jgi:hypothetical protein
MTAETFSKEQLKAINKIAMSSASRLVGLTLAFAILLGIAIGFCFILLSPAEKSSPTLPAPLLLAAIAGQIACFFLIAKFFLRRSFGKVTRRFRLQLTQNVTQHFSPYAWRWFYIVLGIHIVAGIIISVVIPADVSPTGFAIGVGMAAYYYASYHIIMRLLKSGDAQLEPVN